MSIRCFDAQIENAHENRLLETQHISVIFDYGHFQHTYMAVGLACQDWARPSGANCCLGLDWDELGCWQCRQQLEVEQWALALERWTSLQFERPDAQVDEEGAWSSLNTPLNRKWKNFKSLNWLLRITMLFKDLLFAFKNSLGPITCLVEPQELVVELRGVQWLREVWGSELQEELSR